MKLTFSHLLQSEIKHFYENRNTEVLAKKYAFYISYLLSSEFDCVDRDMEEIHSCIYRVNKQGKLKKGGKCPVLKITQADFDVWLKCLKMAMEELRHPENV